MSELPVFEGDFFADDVIANPLPVSQDARAGTDRLDGPAWYLGGCSLCPSFEILNPKFSFRVGLSLNDMLTVS